MSVYYAKLLSSITESTVWLEPHSTVRLWICMLAMADMRGRVWGSVPGIAHRARITREEAEAALACFLSPDPDSRTKTDEGRRIQVIDGGWLLINYVKKRDAQDEEHQAELHAKRQAAYRERQKLAEGDAKVTQSDVNVTGCDDKHKHKHKQKEEEPPTPLKTCEDRIDALMAVSGLIDKTQIHLPRVRMILDPIARKAERDGEDLEKWVDDLDAAWKAFMTAWAEGKLEFQWSAETFFGGGYYKSQASWPWKKNQFVVRKLKAVRE